MAVKMDRHHGLGSRGDRGLEAMRIEVVGARIDVHEHRRRAVVGDGAGGREERVGRRDDLVAGADAERPHGHEQRIRARGAGHRVRRLGVARDLLLERRYLGPADEIAALHDAAHGVIDLGADGVVLRA